MKKSLLTIIRTYYRDNLCKVYCEKNKTIQRKGRLLCAITSSLIKHLHLAGWYVCIELEYNPAENQWSRMFDLHYERTC